MSRCQLVWFRNDLRLHDQPALFEAARHGPVVAVYCHTPAQLREHGLGEARQAFQWRCLNALRQQLAQRGMPLRLLVVERFADVPRALVDLARQVGAERLWFNDEYPLDEQRRDAAVAAACADAGVAVERCVGDLVAAPGSVLTGSGQPYSVFSAFRRRWLDVVAPTALQPLPPPQPQTPVTLDVDGWDTAPDAGLLAEQWPGEEDVARRRLERFLDGGLEAYAEQRDFPALDGTSALSPWFASGTLSVRETLARAAAVNGGSLAGGGEGATAWISELIWREFYRHVVASHPHVSRGEAFRTEYNALPWRYDDAQLQAWQQGRTGYPLVDAGMRQLLSQGWMHNRLRMVVAMFLSKNLLLDWHLGEAWFLQHLVDADFASNNGGWQWSASTGTDAVPYFRVFNPVRQSQRFDPDGAFIRHFVPELAALDGRQIHEPWKVRGVTLEYPAPIVDAGASRKRAIEVFQSFR